MLKKDAVLKPGSRLSPPELVEQDIQVIDNSAALETGLLRHKGNAGIEDVRYTAVWVWRALRRQPRATHRSEFRKLARP